MPSVLHMIRGASLARQACHELLAALEALLGQTEAMLDGDDDPTRRKVLEQVETALYRAHGVLPFLAADQPMTGSDLVALERYRQIHVLGYGPEHDAVQVHGELAMAGALYLAPEPLYRAELFGPGSEGRGVGPLMHCVDPWPWTRPFPGGDGTNVENAHDNRARHSRLRRVVVGGALAAAEADRLMAAGDVVDW
ncbi:MAG: hypothetical protein AB7D57_06700 [Desulfovibrionaceae bacterium]